MIYLLHALDVSRFHVLRPPLKSSIPELGFGYYSNYGVLGLIEQLSKRPLLWRGYVMCLTIPEFGHQIGKFELLYILLLLIQRYDVPCVVWAGLSAASVKLSTLKRLWL